MGLPMARHLLAVGHDVVVCDLDTSRVEALGARAASTAAEAAAGADAVLLSLPSPAAVEDAVLGAEGVRAGATNGALLADLSTGPPALARRLAVECPALDVLDAPVSGGPRGAEEASLTVMVGGSEDAFARAEPLLDVVGALVVRVGGHGAGQAAKLCNNLVAGATMAAVAEACALAVAEGIDPGTLYRLLTASTGDSRVLRTRFPLPGVDAAHPASNGFAPHFALELMAKDLRLALELAERHALDAPVASAALERYQAAEHDGRGGLDYSAVYRRGDGGEASD
jgi:3-hydroxyisobutyrate dehydrogenase